MPAARLVTTPVVLTEAIAGELELHVPPVAASVRLAVAPAHSNAMPVMVPAAGTELTVTMRVAADVVPQPLVTL